MISRQLRYGFVILIVATIAVVAAANITFAPAFFLGESSSDTPADVSHEATGVATPDGWTEAPATPGDWVWSVKDDRSQANFRNGLFFLSCDKLGEVITLSRRGTSTEPVVVTVLTEHESRSYFGMGTKTTIDVKIDPQDSLLDAMAFARGTFGIHVAGLETIYVPSWPEVTRVIEDCRYSS
jgi:hypothetical protein